MYRRITMYHKRIKEMTRFELLNFIQKVIDEKQDPNELSKEIIKNRIEKTKRIGTWYFEQHQRLLRAKNNNDKEGVRHDLTNEYEIAKFLRKSQRCFDKTDHLKSII